MRYTVLLVAIATALVANAAEAELDDNAQQKARTAGQESVDMPETQLGEFWESQAKAAGLITDEDIQEFQNIARSEYERSKKNKDAVTQSFKDVISRDIRERANIIKRPLIIESISDVQILTLHGEVLYTIVVHVKDFPFPLYFVTKGTGGTGYVSGGQDLLDEIDKLGYDVVSEKTVKEQNQPEASVTESTLAKAPEGTPSIDYKGLAEDDTSDLSRYDRDDLRIIAELAAKDYLNKRPQRYADYSDLRDLSIRVGMQHNLVGDKLFAYRTEWQETLEALPLRRYPLPLTLAAAVTNRVRAVVFCTIFDRSFE
jgi:hypothetical protein